MLSRLDRVLQCHVSTYVWLLLGFVPLAVIHSLACFLSWMMVFTIPVAKMNGRILSIVLFLPPDEIQVRPAKNVRPDSFFLAPYSLFRVRSRGSCSSTQATADFLAAIPREQHGCEIKCRERAII